jgi:hypothetical protein
MRRAWSWFNTAPTWLGAAAGVLLQVGVWIWASLWAGRPLTYWELHKLLDQRILEFCERIFK